jgi:septum formation protein
MNLILASASASRRAILQGACIAFEAVSPAIDEDAVKTELRRRGAGPEAVADALAELKALTISTRFSDALIIGADQVLVCDGRLFDKAKDEDDARAILCALKGRNHQLVSAVVLARSSRVLWRYVETTDLRMRDFSDEFLNAYLAEEGEGLLDCVGCYRIEGRGIQLFAKIAGDQFAIRGLPLLPLLDALRQNGALRQ